MFGAKIAKNKPVSIYLGRDMCDWIDMLCYPPLKNICDFEGESFWVQFLNNLQQEWGFN